LRGRKPKDPALKMLSGNPGKRKIEEPKSCGPYTQLPACPKHFKEHARREWNRIGKLLIDTGRLTKLSIKFFVAYCMAVQQQAEAMETLSTESAVLDHPNKGKFRHPACFQLKDATADMIRLSAHFGLTPLDARRITGDGGKKKDKNPFAAIGGGKK